MTHTLPSAHYEFICKEAGIRVHYCAEEFENDGNLASTILKNVKRAGGCMQPRAFRQRLTASNYASLDQAGSCGYSWVTTTIFRAFCIDLIVSIASEMERLGRAYRGATQIPAQHPSASP
jgi:hypothetical protein